MGCQPSRIGAASEYLVLSPVDNKLKLRISTAARSHRQQAWKRQALAREIELEEIHTAPFRGRYGPNSVQITPQAAE